MLKLHSVADTITNSSESIFTYAEKGADDRARTVLAEILQACGVDGSVEDYFEIELIPSSDWWSDTRRFPGDADWKEGYGIFSKADNPALVENAPSVPGAVEDGEYWYLPQDTLPEDLIKCGVWSPDSKLTVGDWYEIPACILSITPKNMQENDIAEKLIGLFGITAFSNG
jgi:hypothetical protein